jgi:uncharacterized Rmd1/YagE family protein
MFSIPNKGMLGKMYDEVLHLYMDRIDDLAIPIQKIYRKVSDAAPVVDEKKLNYLKDILNIDKGILRNNSLDSEHIDLLPKKYNSIHKNKCNDLEDDEKLKILMDIQSTSIFWNYGGKEIFVFNFGALVFWGFQFLRTLFFLFSVFSLLSVFFFK